MIFKGSRYVNSPMVPIKDATGHWFYAIYVDKSVDRRAFDFRYYTVVQGERLDHIAGREYNDPKLWWVIARANPELFYPGDITPGQVIRIPYASSVI